MSLKHRVYEIAKDLNTTSKHIIEVLNNFTDRPKNHMTALSEDELHYVMNHFSNEKKSNKVDNHFANKRNV